MGLDAGDPRGRRRSSTLDLHLGAGVLELLGELLGGRLLEAFLDDLRGALDERLRVRQAEARDLADDLDDLDLLGATGDQRDLEGRGGFGGGRSRGATGRCGRGGGADAPLLL